MKTVIVEDDQLVVDSISASLMFRWPDSAIFSTADSAEALRLVRHESPDILMLDLRLPASDGIEILQNIRKFSQIPVIVVSGRDDEPTRIRALELGADDYVIKPFSALELLSRVAAVLRRSQKPAHATEEGNGAGPAIELDWLRIDTGQRRAFVHGREVQLTPMEWQLLTCLTRNQNRVVSLREIATSLWESDYYDPQTIRVYIGRLRTKLGDDSEPPQLIRSYRGMGYMFSTAEAEHSAESGQP